jgi:hypothetical protein
MLSEALRLPYRAADSTGTLLVGAGLTGVSGLAIGGWLVALLLFPVWGGAAAPLVVLFTLVVFLFALVVRGYLLRVVAAGITATTEAPSFVRWGSLLRNGLKSVLLSAFYALPGIVAGGLTLGGIVVILISPSDSGQLPVAIAAAAIVIGGFGLLCYAFVFLYLRGAARAVLAATGSLRSALAVRRVLGVASSGSYLGGWLVAMGMLTIVPVVLIPALVVSLGAGYVDAVVTLFGVLATGVLGVALWFTGRMSAAWATGNGAAPELLTAGSLGVSDGTTLAVAPVTASSTALPDHEPEAPAAVQTGRSVNPQSTSEAETAAATDSDRIGSDFGMPEPMPPEQSQPTSSDAAPKSDSAVDGTGSASDTPMTVDDTTAYGRATPTADPTAASDAESATDTESATDAESATKSESATESDSTTDAEPTAESEPVTDTGLMTDDNSSSTDESTDDDGEDSFEWGVIDDE